MLSIEISVPSTLRTLHSKRPRIALNQREFSQRMGALWSESAPMMRPTDRRSNPPKRSPLYSEDNINGWFTHLGFALAGELWSDAPSAPLGLRYYEAVSSPTLRPSSTADTAYLECSSRPSAASPSLERGNMVLSISRGFFAAIVTNPADCPVLCGWGVPASAVEVTDGVATPVECVVAASLWTVMRRTIGGGAGGGGRG